MITETKIINGIRAFVDNEIIPYVPDTSLRIVIATGISLIVRDPQKIQTYLTYIPCTQENGYDIYSVLSELKNSVTKYGKLDVTIPSIPLISKEVKTLSFTSSDIDKLISYIERSE